MGYRQAGSHNTLTAIFTGSNPVCPVAHIIGKDCFVSFFVPFLENSEVRSAKAVVRYDPVRREIA